MATRPTWLNVSPISGSGNETLVNWSPTHTGRVARVGVVTIIANGVAEPATYRVNQVPLAEFAYFDNGTEMAASKEGGVITVTGLSNSDRLTFSWADGSPIDVDIPETYMAAGITQVNGGVIGGDPGSEAQFAFNVQFVLPRNESVLDIVRTLTVRCGGGQASQIAIKQSAGDAYLRVIPTEITLNQNGDPVEVLIESNTDFDVV